MNFGRLFGRWQRKPNPYEPIYYYNRESEEANRQREALFPFLRRLDEGERDNCIKLVVDEDSMKKAKAKSKVGSKIISVYTNKGRVDGEVKLNSPAWKALREIQYRRRIAIPSGVKPEDVPFQKKAMDEVDKLPVSEGGKGK